jgi:hypothetical protein
MTTRKDRLERLQIASPCQSPWEAMQGDGRRRHCSQCDKPVYDFARLTPREIAGVIEACRGDLCARLTRDADGRLVVLEPPAAAVDPLASRRVSPLAAAVIAGMLGLGGGATRATGATPVHPPAVVSPVDPEGGDRLEDSQRTGDAGGALSGQLRNETGEPIPDAEVELHGQLDGRRLTGRTDAGGSFSFASLPAGIYDLAASVRGQAAASQSDILLRAGETRQVGLTVPAALWERIAAGAPAGLALGGAIMLVREPLRRAYDGAGLVVVGVAGKSVVARREEYAWQVRTDLVISAVYKGTTGERVISVFHDQMPGEAPASRLQPGDRVLGFLAPRQAENGRGTDGYVATDQVRGVTKLSAAELAAYNQRLAALARLRDGATNPAGVLEWLVATVEDPATRDEAVGELAEAVRRLEQQAGQHGTPVGPYAQALRDVVADFLAAGGELEGQPAPAILGAFLTDAQRERLTAALLRTPDLAAADLDLYELVSPWHDDRLLPWLSGRLEAAERSDGSTRRMMDTLAKALGDDALTDLLETGEAQLEDLEGKREDASSDAAQRRLGAELDAAEDSLLHRFVAVLEQRGR